MEKIALQLVGQVVRAVIIGTIPFLVSLLMGYQIEYWHFLVLAYLVDTGSQLITKILANSIEKANTVRYDN